MTRLFTSKFAVIAALVALFLIVLGMLSSLVQERQQYNDSVLQGIGKDYVNPQTLIAPFIIVPITTTNVCKDDITKNCQSDQNIIITPQDSRWNHQLTVSDQNFKRGIYKAITYIDVIGITGQFILPQTLINPAPNQTVHWDKAELRLSVSDLRGLTNQPILTLGGQKLTFDFPSDEDANPLGISYTKVPISLNAQSQRLDFSLDFSLNGMGSLEVIPVGQDMSMRVSANWPHPSFYGALLPQKDLQADHFSAVWQSTFIANQNSGLLDACLSNGNSSACDSLKTASNTAFAVKFIDAVDAYTMSNRTIKYALLFLLITFGVFFLFEVLQKLRIHPVQYTLVAAALGVFYLLLLSFSEHVGFAMAYLGSSIACVLLLSFYVYYVLKGIGRTLVLTVTLTTMYGALYVILQSEDLTLILGSVLVFILIAATMFLTRHVDWYEVSGAKGV